MSAQMVCAQAIAQLPLNNGSFDITSALASSTSTFDSV
jgi:hypothetical protein